MSNPPPDEEFRRIATFLTAYLATARRMAERFRDRGDIFPEHFLSPFVTTAYSCKDGLVIDLEQRAGEAELRLARAVTRGMGEVLASITFGAFSFGRQRPANIAGGKPALRLMHFSIENQATGQRRAVHDIQLWRRRDVDAWSTSQAERLALDDVQAWLLTYAANFPPQPLEPRALTVLQKILDEYDALITDVTVPEKKLQSFITDYPMLLTPVFQQVIPKKQIGCGKQYEIDFVIRQEADRYLVVEIEKPSTRILTKTGDFTAEFKHAERQMLDFLGWIDENLATARTTMPGISSPRGLVVVGRRRDLDGRGILRLATLNAMRTRYEFLTFDDLLDRGRLVLDMLRSLGR